MTLLCVVDLIFCSQEGLLSGQTGLGNTASDNRALFKNFVQIQTSFKGDSHMKIVAKSIFFKEVK